MLHKYDDITAELSTWAELLVSGKTRQWIQGSESGIQRVWSHERLLRLQKQEFGVLSITKESGGALEGLDYKLFQCLSSSLVHIQYIDDILDKLLESVTRQGLIKSTICPKKWIIPLVWRIRRGQSDKRERGRDGQWSMMSRQEH